MIFPSVPVVKIPLNPISTPLLFLVTCVHVVPSALFTSSLNWTPSNFVGVFEPICPFFCKVTPPYVLLFFGYTCTSYSQSSSSAFVIGIDTRKGSTFPVIWAGASVSWTKYKPKANSSNFASPFTSVTFSIELPIAGIAFACSTVGNAFASAP